MDNIGSGKMYFNGLVLAYTFVQKNIEGDKTFYDTSFHILWGFELENIETSGTSFAV